MIYDANEQRELVSDYVQQLLEAVQLSLNEGGTHHNRPWQDIVHILPMQAVNHLVDMVICFKDEAFREEREWRMIWTTLDTFSPDKVQMRIANDTLVPFRNGILFEIGDGEPKFPLWTISHGPAQNPDLAKFALFTLLNQLEADSHPIKIVEDDIFITQPRFKLRSD